MSYLRLLAMGTASLLMVTACGGSDDAIEVAAEKTDNALFDYVPSDTPYLAGNLEPTPDEVIDVFLQRFAPVIEAVQSELVEARQTLKAASAADDEASVHKEEGQKLLSAILQELDGKLNRQGLESLGFDLRANKVVYGMSVFPVVRVGLSDADVLRATIQRVLATAGINAPELEHQGVPYWRLNAGDAADQAVDMYLAIFADHLAISIFPPMAEAQLLPAFLGLEMPADSNAASRLAELNTEHGYTAYGSGILDLERMVEEFISADTIIGQVMTTSGVFNPAEIASECKTEIRGIISNTPRMTVGTRELTASAIALQYRVETKTTLAQQLVGLVAEVPVANPLSDRILEFSFGMRFGAVRDYLREKAAAIMASPYQCELLESINESASEAYAQLNQPMPPFVNNFRGLRLSLSEITQTDSMPVNGRGLIAVHIDQPEMFVGMARMFLPDLSAMTLVPGEPPVRLPASLIPIPDIVAFAALSAEAIGLSVGDGEEASLPAYLEQKAGPAGTFMSIGYDMAAYLDYTQNMGKQYRHLHVGAADSESKQAATPESYEDIAAVAQQAIKSFSDRTYTSFRFTPTGFEADSRMTFK